MQRFTLRSVGLFAAATATATVGAAAPLSTLSFSRPPAGIMTGTTTPPSAAVLARPPPPLILQGEWCKIPHPNKAAKGGEDDCVATRLVVAVADGVGGWNSVGVDPQAYAYSVCKVVRQAGAEEESGVDAAQIVIQAEKASREIRGSCTVCVATLEKNVLKVANLGDSGLMVLRPTPETLNNSINIPNNDKPAAATYTMVLRTKEQQKSFNFPYQIGTNGDDPTAADKYSCTVQPGDVVVLGSDGLFDNLFDQDIIDFVAAAHAEQLLPHQSNAGKGGATKSDSAAKLLALQAHRLAGNPDYKSPFGVGAAKAGHFSWERGGKMDDITVVLALVVAQGERARL